VCVVVVVVEGEAEAVSSLLTSCIRYQWVGLMSKWVREWEEGRAGDCAQVWGMGFLDGI